MQRVSKPVSQAGRVLGAMLAQRQLDPLLVFPVTAHLDDARHANSNLGVEPVRRDKAGACRVRRCSLVRIVVQRWHQQDVQELWVAGVLNGTVLELPILLTEERSRAAIRAATEQQRRQVLWLNCFAWIPGTYAPAAHSTLLCCADGEPGPCWTDWPRASAAQGASALPAGLLEVARGDGEPLAR